MFFFIVIPALRPNAFSIPFVIFSIPGFDCFSGRHTHAQIFLVKRVGVFHVFVTVHNILTG